MYWFPPARRVFRFLAKQEQIVLLVALMIAGGIWLFAELADEVLEGDTESFDSRIMSLVRTGESEPQPIGPGWLKTAALDVTSLGGVTVLALVVAGAVGYLLLRRKSHAAFVVMAATLGGQALSLGMKWIFNRPRPDLHLHLVEVHTASFPSGHAMLTAAVYLTLGALLARFEKRRRMKTYIVSLALLVTALVGVSRVYLGVHYLTDVLAGWCAGLTWALLCWLVARALQKRGIVEPTTASDQDPDVAGAATASPNPHAR